MKIKDEHQILQASQRKKTDIAGHRSHIDRGQPQSASDIGRAARFLNSGQPRHDQCGRRHHYDSAAFGLCMSVAVCSFIVPALRDRDCVTVIINCPDSRNSRRAPSPESALSFSERSCWDCRSPYATSCRRVSLNISFPEI